MLKIRWILAFVVIQMKYAIFIVIASILPTCGPTATEKPVADARYVKQLVKCVKSGCYEPVFKYLDEGVDLIRGGLNRLKALIGKENELSLLIKKIENLSKLKGDINKAKNAGHVESKSDTRFQALKAIEEIDEKIKIFRKNLSDAKPNFEIEMKGLKDARQALTAPPEELAKYIDILNKNNPNNGSQTTIMMAFAEELSSKTQKFDDARDKALKEVDARIEELTNQSNEFNKEFNEINGIVEEQENRFERIKKELNVLISFNTSKKPDSAEDISQIVNNTKNTLPTKKQIAKAINDLNQLQILGVEDFLGNVLNHSTKGISKRAKMFAIKITEDTSRDKAQIIKNLTFKAGKEKETIMRNKELNRYGIPLKDVTPEEELFPVKVYQVYPTGGGAKRFYFCVATVEGVEHLILSGRVLENKTPTQQKKAFRNVANSCKESLRRVE